MPKLKVTITGEKVHDVGYRRFLLEEADVLFIPNFDARNVKIDGKQAVMALVDGDDAQVKEFTDFCRSSFPAEASVGNVSVKEYGGRIRDIGSFRDSLSINQLSKIARVGVAMLDKQDELKTITEQGVWQAGCAQGGRGARFQRPQNHHRTRVQRPQNHHRTRVQRS